MIYSRTSRHAIEALAYMAKQPKNKTIGIRAISESTNVPPAYIAKVFQVLAHSGFVSSQWGPSGGYCLTRDPNHITLFDIVNVVDDIENSPLSGCAMGFDRCSDESACLLHKAWIRAAKQMKKELQKRTITDLAEATHHLRRFAKSRRVLSRDVRAVFR